MDDRVLSGIGAAGHALKESVAEITGAYVERMESDAALPEAASVPVLDLEDHAASLLIDIAQSLVATAEHDVDVTRLLSDGTEIQRLIAALHGAQRARLGWSEQAILREFEILAEEVEAAIRRQAGPGAQVDSAIDLVSRSLGLARDVSLEELRRSR